MVAYEKREFKLAYSDESIPDQDWELALFSEENIDNIFMICEFIEDEKCSKKSFFGTLYVLTGDVITSNNQKYISQLTRAIIEMKPLFKSQSIIKWIKRSEKLIEKSETYSYEYWGLNSRYVYKQLTKNDQ
ncbi:hypothetical protein BCR25_10210 [Enterococcus termitis]|uniref:Uncharacterized protein n=1 Tax=Enterococcus termitis TaxID=332950 RepID=A0A1E5GAZ4_9ENTE|nr:hypothetical protein BCR25_10210 [Enterococcus termitis]